jgi:S-adenosylmethionine-diacylgycerolhomoserine-N-methlytransferase
LQDGGPRQAQGGLIGAVDFYVSQKWPGEGLRKHGWLCRSLWPVWFASDNVFPSPDHLPFLRHKFETVWLDEQTKRLPYVPLLRTPYYVFIGRKPVA